jgi:hypothetical protein
MDSRRATGPSLHNTRFIWLTLEGPDVIEVKQVALDRDVPGALAFFQRVVVPQVRLVARQRGIPVDTLEESESGGSLPG